MRPSELRAKVAKAIDIAWVALSVLTVSILASLYAPALIRLPEALRVVVHAASPDAKVMVLAMVEQMSVLVVAALVPAAALLIMVVGRHLAKLAAVVLVAPLLVYAYMYAPSPTSALELNGITPPFSREIVAALIGAAQLLLIGLFVLPLVDVFAWLALAPRKPRPVAPPPPATARRARPPIPRPAVILVIIGLALLVAGVSFVLMKRLAEAIITGFAGIVVSFSAVAIIDKHLKRLRSQIRS